MDKVPYMQRGGAWDNSDLTEKNKKKVPKPRTTVVKNDKVSKKIVATKWSETDKAYANVRRYAVALRRRTFVKLQLCYAVEDVRVPAAH